jgi:hypothetical protein
MRLDPGEVQRVGLRGIQPRLRAASGIVVLADEDLIGQQGDHRTGRRVRLKQHRGGQVALVVAVEVDLEGAADVGFVVGVVVEGDVVDLDGAVVARRVGRRGSELRDRNASRHHHGGDDQPNRLPGP